VLGLVVVTWRGKDDRGGRLTDTPSTDSRTHPSIHPSIHLSSPFLSPLSLSLSLSLESGGYTLYVTGHGDKNYTNELRALPEGVKSGQFDVFFRIYVEVRATSGSERGMAGVCSAGLLVACGAHVCMDGWV
jgi:hypothetical protein